ncbi:hypothetical protein VP01_1573g1 [Puccinia sorghi]|uniref:Uncharacterized protein n=1 Tax=Puccinia sorghi TaxID=27349 RepID=A0A0L6VHS6_9BASI|nr:hypothetical protein VP01_1573g1 [Puccinia sorghi]
MQLKSCFSEIIFTKFKKIGINDHLLAFKVGLLIVYQMMCSQSAKLGKWYLESLLDLFLNEKIKINFQNTGKKKIDKALLLVGIKESFWELLKCKILFKIYNLAIAKLKYLHYSNGNHCDSEIVAELKQYLFEDNILFNFFLELIHYFGYLESCSGVSLNGYPMESQDQKYEKNISNHEDKFPHIIFYFKTAWYINRHYCKSGSTQYNHLIPNTKAIIPITEKKKIIAMLESHWIHSGLMDHWGENIDCSVQSIPRGGGLCKMVPAYHQTSIATQRPGGIHNLTQLNIGLHHTETPNWMNPCLLLVWMDLQASMQVLEKYSNPCSLHITNDLYRGLSSMLNINFHLTTPKSKTHKTKPKNQQTTTLNTPQHYTTQEKHTQKNKVSTFFLSLFHFFFYSPLPLFPFLDYFLLTGYPFFYLCEAFFWKQEQRKSGYFSGFGISDCGTWFWRTKTVVFGEAVVAIVTKSPPPPLCEYSSLTPITTPLLLPFAHCNPSIQDSTRSPTQNFPLPLPLSSRTPQSLPISTPCRTAPGSASLLSPSPRCATSGPPSSLKILSFVYFGPLSFPHAPCQYLLPSLCLYNPHSDNLPLSFLYIWFSISQKKHPSLNQVSKTTAEMEILVINMKHFCIYGVADKCFISLINIHSSFISFILLFILVTVTYLVSMILPECGSREVSIQMVLVANMVLVVKNKAMWKGVFGAGVLQSQKHDSSQMRSAAALQLKFDSRINMPSIFYGIWLGLNEVKLVVFNQTIFNQIVKLLLLLQPFFKNFKVKQIRLLAFIIHHFGPIKSFFFLRFACFIVPTTGRNLIQILVFWCGISGAFLDFDQLYTQILVGQQSCPWDHMEASNLAFKVGCVGLNFQYFSAVSGTGPESACIIIGTGSQRLGIKFEEMEFTTRFRPTISFKGVIKAKIPALRGFVRLYSSIFFCITQVITQAATCCFWVPEWQPNSTIVVYLHSQNILYVGISFSTSYSSLKLSIPFPFSLILSLSTLMSLISCFFLVFLIQPKLDLNSLPTLSVLHLLYPKLVLIQLDKNPISLSPFKNLQSQSLSVSKLYKRYTEGYDEIGSINSSDVQCLEKERDLNDKNLGSGKLKEFLLIFFFFQY